MPPVPKITTLSLPGKEATARRIAANAPVAVRAAKEALSRATGLELKDGLKVEIDCYRRTIETDDRREGMLAYNENRKPVYRGR